MTTLKFSATALAVGSALAAQAAPVTVSQTMTLGQVLNGNSANFQFNVNSALASQGVAGGTALSGTLVVYGISDASYNSSTGAVFGNYETIYSGGYTYYAYGGCYYSWWGGSSCYYYPVYASYTEQLRSGDVTHRDTVADTMTVSAGNATASDVVDQWITSSTGYGGYNYEGQYSTGNGYTTLYNRQRDVYEALQGDLQTSLALDLAGLADVQGDGVLSFSVGASAGQFRVLSATLNLVVEERRGLPEPGTLVLVGAAALTGASFTRRRRKS
ncbi:PEP-CTERM sorting domain-containing protein [Roseateles sp. P5_E7]